VSGFRVLAPLAVVLLTVGCSTCSLDAGLIRRELWASNVAGAQGDMTSAAARVGAELLPAVPVEMRALPVCSGEVGKWPEVNCQTWSSEDQRMLRVLDAHGKSFVVFTIHTENFRYARLARRGNEFFVLEPLVTRRKWDEATECHCNAMPDNGTPRWHGFIVKAGPYSLLEPIRVPVTEDYIEWGCETSLL
jgi:hypothetical protein